MLGAVLEASWEVLEAYKRRLGGSLGRLGAVLGALEAMLEQSGAQKVPKIRAQEGPKSNIFGINFEIDFGCVLGTPKS